MISNFTYRSDPVRIVFGAGAVAALRAEIEFHNLAARGFVLADARRFREAGHRASRGPLRRLLPHTGQHMPRDAFEHIIGEIQAA